MSVERDYVVANILLNPETHPDLQPLITKINRKILEIYESELIDLPEEKEE